MRPAVNKGGTAFMTPFAGESRQRAFLAWGRHSVGTELENSPETETPGRVFRCALSS